MLMTNSYFHAPVAPWVRHLARLFRIAKMMTNDAMEACHCYIGIAFKTVYLILTRGIFVNLDCNLQTAEVKRASAIDAGGSTKQTTYRHSFVVGHCSPNVY